MGAAVGLRHKVVSSRAGVLAAEGQAVSRQAGRPAGRQVQFTPTHRQVGLAEGIKVQAGVQLQHEAGGQRRHDIAHPVPGSVRGSGIGARQHAATAGAGLLAARQLANA